VNQGQRSGHVFEVVCEIRFAGSKEFPTGVILPGLLYTQLHQSGVVGKFEPLAQAAIPSQIRLADNNLRFLPTHRMVGDGVVVAVGDHTVNVSQVEGYAGWDTMRDLTRNVFAKSLESGALGQVERTSLKYLNLIPGELGTDHFGMINASIHVGSRKLSDQQAQIRTELLIDGLIAVVQMTAQARLERVGGLDDGKPLEGQNGLVLEIDVLCPKEFSGIDDIMDGLERAHAVAIQLYMDIVKGGGNVS
jgi:uncharacterized protein (TIGR04255 family)